MYSTSKYILMGKNCDLVQVKALDACHCSDNDGLCPVGLECEEVWKKSTNFFLSCRESTSEEANIFSIVCKLRSEIHLRLNMVSILHKTRTNKIQVAWVAGINI